MTAKNYQAKRAVSTLAAGGVADRLVATTDGVAMAMSQLTAGMVPANLITQAVLASGSTSGPTIANASYADIPEMSITLTTAASGLVIVMMWGAFFNNTLGNTSGLCFQLDGSGTSFPCNMNLTQNSVTNCCIIGMFSGLSAGSHTIKGRWNSGNAAHTLTAFSTQRHMVGVELRK